MAMDQDSVADSCIQVVENIDKEIELRDAVKNMEASASFAFSAISLLFVPLIEIVLIATVIPPLLHIFTT